LDGAPPTLKRKFSIETRQIVGQLWHRGKGGAIGENGNIPVREKLAGEKGDSGPNAKQRKKKEKSQRTCCLLAALDQDSPKKTRPLLSRKRKTHIKTGRETAAAEGKWGE